MIIHPIKTDEKTGIMYRKWEAASPSAVLLLVHGLGAHSARWEFLAEIFLFHNISSYAIELKGCGETPGPKGHIDSFNIYYNDIRSLRDIIIRENPGKKIFLAGESLGGLIVYIFALTNPDLFDGLIALSPAFSNRFKLSVLYSIKVFLPLLYNPKKQHKMPFTSRMCTHDTTYEKAMDADHREHRLATSKFLFNLLAAQIRAGSLKDKGDMHILFLLSGNDEIVDPDASKKVFEKLAARDKKIMQYPDMRHALSIDTGKEKVAGDILDWVNERCESVGTWPKRL
ncbi:MAG: alpha/beta fold hydrolase [Candidatus Omnitrophota bacterium]|nr:alpha/beta fold hydrolase [Candidatus Omnitrophota bacterium]